jgi:hypothetical protein
MSDESWSTLPKGTPLGGVRDALDALGYLKCSVPPFFSPKVSLAYSWFDTLHYRSFVGVYLDVAENQEGVIEVYTRTNEGRSFYDCEHQNLTIRTLRRKFGGEFRTDMGIGRYFKPDRDAEKPDQAGCHLAFQRFGHGIIRAHGYLSTLAFNDEKVQVLYQVMPGQDPRVLSRHLLLTYLAAVFEEYTRSTFVALLRYLPSKEAILKGARLSGKQLADVSDGALSIDEAFAQNLHFQNALQASEHLKLLDRRLDLAGLLRRPYRTRKTTLLDGLLEMVTRRNAFVHGTDLELNLNEKLMWKYLDDLETAVVRFYRHLTSLHGWEFSQGWGRGKGSTRLSEGMVKKSDTEAKP